MLLIGTYDTDVHSCHCPLKEFDYNAGAEFADPVADTTANAAFQGADADRFIKANDIVLKGKPVQQKIHRAITTSRRREKDKWLSLLVVSNIE